MRRCTADFSVSTIRKGLLDSTRYAGRCCMTSKQKCLKPISCAIVIGYGFFFASCGDSIANEVLEASLRNARDAEAQGRDVEAISQYLAIAQQYGASSGSAYGAMPIDLARLLQRRVLALRICAIKKGSDSVPPNSIYSSYLALKKLEPDNPTWPYLQAMYKLKVLEQYFDVYPLFHQSINCTGGEPSVRQKAIADLNRYRPVINTAVDQENAATKKKDWDWDHGGKERYEAGLNAMIHAHHSPAPKTSSGDKKPGDWASSQNAQKAGDWGAASRFDSGSSTWTDRNSYTRY